MHFLIAIAVKLLEWILTIGGKALYEYTTKLVEKHKQEAIERENLKRYEEARKRGASDKEMLDRERDLINGDN